MSSESLVSGIVPFLNAEKFIHEAVESMLAQTYDGWELLLVDDDSTNGSTLIAKIKRRNCELIASSLRSRSSPLKKSAGRSGG